jgi:acyl-CoA thioester hydrolase
MNEFRHKIPIQIRFSDIDRLNHVNNACYLNYFELGRVNYLNDVLKDLIDWTTQGFILARTEIDHLDPLFLDDQPLCYTRIASIGNKSIRLENLITKRSGETIIECAKGVGILVAMDYKKRESVEVPEHWRKAASEFEGLSFNKPA